MDCDRPGNVALRTAFRSTANKTAPVTFLTSVPLGMSSAITGYRAVTSSIRDNRGDSMFIETDHLHRLISRRPGRRQKAVRPAAGGPPRVATRGHGVKLAFTHHIQVGRERAAP